MRRNHKRAWLVVAGLVAYLGLFATSRESRVSRDDVAEATEITAEQAPGSQTLALPSPVAVSTAKPRTPMLTSTKDVAPPEPAATEPEYETDGPRPLDPDDLASRAQERVMLDTRWATQSTDPSWSDQTEAKIAGLLEEAGLDPSAASELDCRKTICRLMLSARTGPDARRMIDVARSLHDETWVDHHEHAGDGWEIEVFLSRPGWRLSGDGSQIENAT